MAHNYHDNLPVLLSAVSNCIQRQFHISPLKMESELRGSHTSLRISPGYNNNNETLCLFFTVSKLFLLPRFHPRL